MLKVLTSFSQIKTVGNFRYTNFISDRVSSTTYFTNTIRTYFTNYISLTTPDLQVSLCL